MKHAGKSSGKKNKKHFLKQDIIDNSFPKRSFPVLCPI